MSRASSVLTVLAACAMVATAISPAVAAQPVDPDAVAPTGPGRPWPSGLTPCDAAVTIGTGQGEPGGAGPVPVRLSNTVELASGAFDVSDKPDLLQATACVSLVSGVDCTVVDAGGDAMVQFTSGAGSGIPSGSGVERFVLQYDVAPAAPTGTVSLVPMDLSAISTSGGDACQVVGFAGTFAVVDCGNGTIDPGEACDDGNTAGGDCCAADCQYEPGGAACDDGLFCTGADACDGAGVCVAGDPLDCDDGVDCTADTCDEAADVCVSQAQDGLCDDGTFCNGAEMCDAAAGCLAGTPPDCDDGVDCTVDTCDETANACVNQPDSGVCQDGLFCNGQEVCDAAGGCQPSPAPPCSAQFCDETQDACATGVPLTSGGGLLAFAGLILLAGLLVFAPWRWS